MNKIKYAREIPAAGTWDVIVAGGGPSGLCAAVASSRRGAKTLLVERYGVLGGNLTVGVVAPLLGGVAPGTMADEVREILGGRRYFDPEEAKGILTRWVDEAGVEIMLQAPVVAVVKEGDNLAGLVIGSKKGLTCLQGKIFIDATGDADVAAFAGVPYVQGRKEDGLVQPVSLMFVVSNVEEDAIICEHEAHHVDTPHGDYLDVCKQACARGELPANVTIVRLYHGARPCERVVNATQLCGIDGTDPVEVARAEVNLREQIGQVIAFLRKYAPGYENCQLKISPSTLGVRETRRPQTKVVLQREDLVTGRFFEDAVVEDAIFSIDIHNPAGGGQAEGIAARVRPYTIPYGTMLPEGVDNLLLTGRAIGGTHDAHASFRVMNIAMALGQAAGTAASYAVEKGIKPSDVEPKAIRDLLRGQGVKLTAVN